MTDGIKLINQKREAQIYVKGYTALSDLAYVNNELIDAAIAYVHVNASTVHTTDAKIPKIWPWLPKFFMPSTNSIDNLAKAGALIAAEIDRQLLMSVHKRKQDENSI